MKPCEERQEQHLLRQFELSMALFFMGFLSIVAAALLFHAGMQAAGSGMLLLTALFCVAGIKVARNAGRSLQALDRLSA